LRERLDSTGPNAPLGGITGGGWKLVYNEEPNEYIAADDSVSGGADFTSSIGLRVKGDGSVIDATPGMPAFEAGISPYLKIVAVNGRQFSTDELKRVVHDSISNSAPIKLDTMNAGTLETHEIEYHGGSRYPHLERVEGSPDYMDDALKSLTPASVH
jgi:predicted metalloprotease with PDZ domain